MRKSNSIRIFVRAIQTGILRSCQLYETCRTTWLTWVSSFYFFQNTVYSIFIFFSHLNMFISFYSISISICFDFQISVIVIFIFIQWLIYKLLHACRKIFLSKSFDWKALVCKSSLISEGFFQFDSNWQKKVPNHLEHFTFINSLRLFGSLNLASFLLSNLTHSPAIHTQDSPGYLVLYFLFICKANISISVIADDRL